MAQSARSSARSRPRGDTTVPAGSTAVGASDEPAEPTGAAAGPTDDEQPAGMTAQDLAARRRAALDSTPAEHLPGAPADPSMPANVIVSRGAIDGAQGDGSPGRPVGPAWEGMPIVLQQQPGAAGGKLPSQSAYVIAEFGASSLTRMPGCTTAVSRKEWSPGQLVRRDVYQAAIDEHQRRVATGTVGAALDAELPAGRDQLPPDVVAYGPSDGPALVAPGVHPAAGTATTGGPDDEPPKAPVLTPDTNPGPQAEGGSTDNTAAADAAADGPDEATAGA